MKITALAGGVGGSKLLVGLQSALSEGELTAIVNTGDDAVIYDVHVSPDVDIVTYWLSGLADVERGWGIKDDTFTVIEGLGALGVDTWFCLGDRDLATCMYRTSRLEAGATLTEATDEIRRALQVPTRILPMSDDPVPTRIATAERVLEFQEYFVKERCEPEVTEVRFAGIADAKPGPAVIDSIRDADRVIVCPSNPVVSIAPILALPEVRVSLQEHPFVAAVTPIVNGAPLKGPADKLLPVVGAEVSAAGVAGLYADFCEVFIVDQADANEASDVEQTVGRSVVLDTLMPDHFASERLAKELLAL